MSILDRSMLGPDVVRPALGSPASWWRGPARAGRPGGPGANGPGGTDGGAGRRRWRPVRTTLGFALALHLLWWLLLANAGGDIAAQDAWAEFARLHPDSAYNLAWYGGIHPVSYSAISPYLMALFGVRPLLVLAGTLSAGLVAHLLVRMPRVTHPLPPSLYAALAFLGNAVSGRVTFALGTLFGLAAIAVVFAWPQRWAMESALRERRLRGVLVVVLSATSTLASPVSGLFVGLIAAALWLRRRRRLAYALGVPPVLVVVASSVFFPFSGDQPMHANDLILPVVMCLAAFLLVPRTWRTLRLVAAIYFVSIFAAWLVPSPIGANIVRLGLIFGGVVLIATATRGLPRRAVMTRWVGPAVTAFLLFAAICTATTWQVMVAAKDEIDNSPPSSWADTIRPLIAQLQSRHAALGRVEVVPTTSHRESSALAPYVDLARGWNRQADVVRNPLFYRPVLRSVTYRGWLHRLAVRYVVVSDATPDPAGLAETKLIRGGVPYLREVWSNRDWTLYAVVNPTPLVSAPATVRHFGAAMISLEVPAAGQYVVRVPFSPWLSLVDPTGAAIPAPSPDGTVPDGGCLTDVSALRGTDPPRDDWLVLRAPAPGVYRIAAPYRLPRGTRCPQPTS